MGIKKPTQRIAVAVMLFLLGITTLHVALPSVEASLSDITSDSIEEKEEELESAEQEKEVLQSNVTELEDLLTSLEATKDDLSNYVAALDVSLGEINDKISELSALIAEKQEEIEQTEKELEEALAVEAEQYAEMQKRIQFIYEQGDYALTEMLLSSESFGDILNKADYIEMLSAYDRSMLDNYIATRETIESIMELLEEEEAILEDANLAMIGEQGVMEDLIDVKEQEITAYQSDITNKEALRAELENQIAQESAIIEALELAIAEERRQIAEENGLLLSYDGGMFAWPAPSYTYISSDYGWRIHPILGEEIFHSGVDMAAPAGSPILAAYDGKVVASAYSSSMGNYVMIDHGDELYTIYMHASELYVTTGQVVIRGEKIAAVGTTGLSTGNHLHFGVRLNGDYVSPWSYLQ
ncbi:MAG: peptidoglycan DD-metalloendopeptidase family protein [Eubacteriales bacterium]